MAEMKSLARPGDAVVDGLLAGVGAGAAMAAYLIGIGWLVGEAPAAMLGRFAPGASGSPLVGLLAHLAVAGVYGALFGLSWRFVPSGWRGRWSGLVAGSIYGLALFALAVTVLLPASASPLGEIPTLHFALGHFLYGVALGLLMARK